MKKLLSSELFRPKGDKQLRILLLCDYDPTNAGTVVDSIDAFRMLSRHDYVVRSGRGNLLARVDLSQFDGIFIHYSLVACYDSYLAPESRRRIRTFQGYKAIYIQDEYRFIDNTIAAINYMHIHVLFSVVGPEVIDHIYPPERLPHLRKVTVLTGYVPDTLIGIATPAYHDRTLDVSYRARKLPPYLGEHTLQKWQISDRFAQDAEKYGLKVNLSWREEDRIYGEAWVKFMANSKASLGTESGASVCDFTGAIEARVTQHLRAHPEATFEELRELYFKEEDGRYVINCISPRCFEAAALRTLMIMYPGNYSGAMIPWQHYVPLARDHSNMEEVGAILHDEKRANEIIERAYQHLIASDTYSYRSMMEVIDGTMETCIAAGLAPSPKPKASKVPKVTRSFYGECIYLFVTVTHKCRLRLHHYSCALSHRLYNWFVRHQSCKRLMKYVYVYTRNIAARHHRLVQQLRKWLPGVSALMDSTHTLLRLRSLQRFFLRQQDTSAHLYVTPQAGIIDIVASPIGAEHTLSVKQKISAAELRGLINLGNIHTMRWINGDILGLGTLPPFERHHVLGTCLSTDFLYHVFMDKLGLPWIEDIVVTAETLPFPNDY